MFDLKLSNLIYKANVDSLITLSDETLQRNADQNIENLILSMQSANEEQSADLSIFERAKHLANIDWLFLNSIFISVFSYFEYHLFALSKIVEGRSKSKIKIEDISGSGILQYMKYLHLVGQIEIIDKGRHDMQIIQKFRKTRNALVHQGNNLISDPNKVLQNHELYDFLTSEEVTLAGSLGHIRLRNTKLLKTFGETTFFISDSLIQHIEGKFPE